MTLEGLHSDDCSPFCCKVPPEVFTLIFSFLPHSDLKSARLVSLRWYSISLVPQLINTEALVMSSDVIDRMTMVKKCERHFYHLKLMSIAQVYNDEALLKKKCGIIREDVWGDCPLWIKVGPMLKSLALHKCSLSRKKGEDFINLTHCKKLEFLSFFNCSVGRSLCGVPKTEPPAYSGNPFPHLKSLQTLKIANAVHFEGNLAMRIIANAPNLKHLFLENCLPTSKRDHISGTLCCDHFLGYFQKFPERIVQLHLKMEQEECAKKKLVKVLLLPNIQLATLVGNFFPKAVYESRQEHCQELILTTRGNDSMLESICINFPNLKKFDFLCGPANSAVSHFCLLNKLTNLSLSSFTAEVHEADLLAGLCSAVTTNLKEVNFVFNAGVKSSSVFFIEFSRTHPSLTRLSLESCEGVDDWALQAIFKYQQSLKHLKISKCADISDTGLSGEVLFGPLKENQTENPTGHSISCLKDLQSLDLSCCYEVKGVTFERGLKFPKMELINLNKTKVSLKAFECLVENHPLIKYLSLADLPFVTDELVHYVIKKLPQLKEICLVRSEAKVSRTTVDFLRGKGVTVPYDWRWRIES